MMGVVVVVVLMMGDVQMSKLGLLDYIMLSWLGRLKHDVAVT
jgi:uncharacterized membrane protein YcaP (DUF421 family)